MKKIKAEKLFDLSTDELWELPEEVQLVQFPDGTVETHTRATIASVYLWAPLRRYPLTLSKRFHLGQEWFTSKRMLAYINRVIDAIREHYGDQADKEVLMREAFDTVNKFYNDATVKLSPYVATMSMFDVLEVMYQPDIHKANKDVRPTQYSIEEECYPAIDRALTESDDLRCNPLAMAVRSGTLKIGQVQQCVGPRGFITDINSDIFPEPITKSYVEGINDLYGSMIESRMGTKSLLFNAELLRETEYFNRKSQLVAQYLKRLNPGDCGTPHLVDFPVMEGLLRHMKGKYYVNPTTGKLDCFTGNEKHLVGQRVKMRSVLGCVHPDPAGICSVCYGQMADSVPYNTNIGHVSAVIVGDKITSSVLSTKHLDSTSRVERFIIHPTEGKYLCYRKEPEMLYLKRELRGKKIRLVVFRSEVGSLADVLMLNDLSDYPVTNASQLTQVSITVADTVEELDAQPADLLQVSLYNRKSSFSIELLEYIRKKKWTYNETDNVVIDLTDFDVDKPFLSLPYKHVNMYEVMMKLQTFLHSGSDGDSKSPEANRGKRKRMRTNALKNYRDAAEGLAVFATMLNDKLSVNLVHCEVLAYVMMIRSPLTNDYRLPKPGIAGFYEKFNNIMLNRSLAGVLAFEKQVRALVNPRIYINPARSDHPYDQVLLGGAYE